MDLVERFIEFGGWPTSRKTVLLCLIALPGLLFNAAVVYGVMSPLGVVDMDRLSMLNNALSVSVFICMVLSWLTDRAGKDGRWTAYLFVISYGSCSAYIIYTMGGWTSPLTAVYAMAVLLSTLYFNTRVAWFAFVFGLFTLFVPVTLTALDVIPFAPALIARGVDAQNQAGWIVAIALPIMMTLAVCFALSLLIVAARQRQDARLRTAQKLIGRYVPSQLAEKIMTGDHSADIKPERRKLAIFFSDVEGFTDASDELDAEDLAGKLNEYLSEMTVIADRYGATVNQLVGDGIMIFFGAPQATDDKDHALRAVRMALDMQKRMQELREIWFKRGFQKPFRIRIGVNTGYASVGDYGSQGRMVYSAIGLQTNLAARIQAQCEPGKILISHSTWALVNEQIPCAARGELQVKGIHYPVLVYEVTAPA